MESLEDCPEASEADWADVLLPLSQLDCRDERFEDALSRAPRAFAYHDQLEQRDDRLWKFALLIQAAAHAALGLCDETEAATLRSLEFVSQFEAHDTHQQYKGMKVLADVYLQQVQYETALTLYQRIVETLEQDESL